jgi:hypothetical protein
MYVCVKGIHFASFYYFRKCGIFFFQLFQSISLFQLERYRQHI